MTDFLFLRDAYVKDFNATIVSSEDVYIVLDQTLFYPEGGGQPTDQGIIKSGSETWNVLKVRIRSGKVLHKLNRAGLTPGTQIKGQLNWDRRYSIMRYHTALHILSKVVFDEFGSEVTGNQIYPNRARMDFTMDKLTSERLELILENTHQVIEDARSVQIRFLTREEATKTLNPKFTRLEMIPKSVTEIRIVDINGFNQDACGGTHVKNTKEIGHLSVTKTLSKGKLNRRIEFTL